MKIYLNNNLISLYMTTVFWDVDTQDEFMAGAGEIIPNLRSLTKYAGKKKITVIASQDHGKSGKLSKIEATSMKSPVNIKHKRYEKHQLKNMLKNRREVIIHKKEYSMLSNPNSDFVMKRLGVKKAVVYGVATDYCVLNTVKDLRERNIDVVLVKDAIAAVDEKKGEKALSEMKKLGIKEVLLHDVIEGRF